MVAISLILQQFAMSVQRPILILATLLLLAGAVRAQHAQPPSAMADDLCECLGTINGSENDRNFDLAVRHCLNTMVVKHSHEVIGLLQRYPMQDRRFYLLGLLLGSALDRTCPQYPLIKDRLQLLQEEHPPTPPTT